MAYDSLDPTDGHPIYLDSGALDDAVDKTQAAAYAGQVGTRPIGTTAQRLAYPFARKGLAFFDTDLGVQVTHNGVGWNPPPGNLLFSTSGSTQPVSGSGFSTILTGSFTLDGPVLVHIQPTFVGQADTVSLGFYRVLLNGTVIGQPTRVANLGQVNAPQAYSKMVPARAASGSNTVVVQGNRDASVGGWYANSPQLEVWAA